MEKEKKLGSAELEIMQTIWASGGACSSPYIFNQLKDSLGWKMPTLMTSLSRLVDKGYLACDKSGGMNRYSPLVSEQDYKAKEGGSFLRRVYNNSVRDMVASLYQGEVLGEQDMAELRAFLDELEGQR